MFTSLQFNKIVTNHLRLKIIIFAASFADQVDVNK